MKRIARMAAFGLLGLGGLLVLALAVVYLLSNARIQRRYGVEVEALPLPTDAERLARGEHLATIRGCRGCHGPDLGGQVLLDDPALGRIYASNLTAGQGGIGGTYTDEDWVRAIRHGLGPDGRPLLIMPASEFYYLSDADLSDLIAYLRTVPPVDRILPEDRVGPLGRILFLLGRFPLLEAEGIDHDAPRPTAPPPGVTVAYGEYLARGCIGCHGPDFSGGPIASGPPDWPPAADLTPAGDLARWTLEDFVRTLRTGVRPDGTALDPVMPYEAIGQMTDEELEALWLFLRSLPPRP